MEKEEEMREEEDEGGLSSEDNERQGNDATANEALVNNRVFTFLNAEGTM